MGRVPVSGEAGLRCFREEKNDEPSRRDESHSHVTAQAATSSAYSRPLSLLYHLEGPILTKQKGSSSKLLHEQNLLKSKLSYIQRSVGGEKTRLLFSCLNERGAWSKHQRGFSEGA